MYDNWKKIYRRQIHTRFKSASGGDGTWPPLARSTAKRKKSSLILVETRTLLNAVDPDIYNAPGSVGQRTNSGLLIGYGGNVVHPTSTRTKRSTTIAEIAEFHQVGGGRLPQRKIIVAPTKERIDAVTAEIRSATADIIKEVSL